MSSPALFSELLSDTVLPVQTVTPERAANLFQFFRDCPLFRWQDTNNDCEDRANALCILLDHWQIPNCKAWVFSGYFLGRDLGSLVNFWNYHVATALPVLADGILEYWVIDPATGTAPVPATEWAAKITSYPHSYFAIKDGRYYIFPPPPVLRDNWYKRNRQNYKWTIQGLSGINGVSRTGKAQLIFNKARIRATENAFKKLLHQGPGF